MDSFRKEVVIAGGSPMWEEYTIEAAANKEDLRRLVKKMIGNGWQPLGGVCIDLHEDKSRYLQAMVRNRKDIPKD